MKDKFDVLFSRDECDIEHISENYAAAGEREKERIYKMCKRKYDMERAEELQVENDGYTRQAEGVERYRRPILSRILTAAAALIAVAGLAGGMKLILHRGAGDYGADAETSQTAPADTDLEAITPTPEDGEFAPLQLHELKEFDDYEAFRDYRDSISKVWDNGGYEFKGVDVERYAQQILSASSHEELNSLENKSFVYHLMINKPHYFDTAEIKYNVKYNIDGKTQTKVDECAVDLGARYIYNKISFMNGEDIFMYDIRDGNKDLSIADKLGLFSEKEVTDEEWECYTRYVPDNDRIAFYIASDKEDIADLWIAGSSMPFSFYDYSLMCHFENWSIEGTESILDRDCVRISCDVEGQPVEEWIDLRTGIILKEEAKYSIDVERGAEAISLILNEPIEKREIDLTGFKIDGVD